MECFICWHSIILVPICKDIYLYLWWNRTQCSLTVTVSVNVPPIRQEKDLITWSGLDGLGANRVATRWMRMVIWPYKYKLKSSIMRAYILQNQQLWALTDWVGYLAISSHLSYYSLMNWSTNVKSERFYYRLSLTATKLYIMDTILWWYYVKKGLFNKISIAMCFWKQILGLKWHILESKAFCK